MPRLLTSLRAGVLLAALLVLLGGCDDEELFAPEPPPTGELFARYVAIGNSITAGFQSGGINESLQRDAFPVLVAEQMGAPFYIPELNLPGCPPPLVQVFPEPERAGPAGVECALRQVPLPPYLNNVAVPGAAVIDVLSNLDVASNANPLTTLILGGRTQLEAALEADPTFVSVWIGNNDVLGAALQGNTDLLTGVDDFRERYTDLLDGLDEAEALEGGLLFGVVNVTAVPALSAGAAYFQAVPVAQAVGAAPPNLEVAPSCVPSANGGVGDRTLVPFQHGATLLQVASTLYAQLGENAPTLTLDCAQDRTVEATVGDAFGGVANIPEAVAAAIASTADISLLEATEIGELQQTVAAYNALISEQAAQRGYAYLDVNPLFAANAALIPPFPALIDDPTTPDVDESETPFGPLFSLDGVHPSSRTHEIVAGAMIDAVNAEYGTSIPSP